MTLKFPDISKNYSLIIPQTIQTDSWKRTDSNERFVQDVTPHKQSPAKSKATDYRLNQYHFKIPVK